MNAPLRFPRVIRRMFSRDSGLSIVPIIGVTLAVYLLAACALQPARETERIVRHCDGSLRNKYVRVEESWAPGLRCAELWLLAGAHPVGVGFLLAALPVACTVVLPAESYVVVVPPGSRDGGPILEHELEHTLGYVHPIPGVPVGSICRG